MKENNNSNKNINKIVEQRNKNQANLSALPELVKILSLEELQVDHNMHR